MSASASVIGMKGLRARVVGMSAWRGARGRRSLDTLTCIDCRNWGRLVDELPIGNAYGRYLCGGDPTHLARDLGPTPIGILQDADSDLTLAKPRRLRMRGIVVACPT